MKIKRRTLKVEVPNVAMGDIAFNLLIFFVILAKAQDDTHLRWTPAAAVEIKPAGEIRVRVLIDVDNKVYMNGKEIGVSQLAKSIEEHLDGLEAGNRIVAFKVNREAPASTFEPVIEAISQAGGDLVHILAEQGVPR